MMASSGVCSGWVLLLRLLHKGTRGRGGVGGRVVAQGLVQVLRRLGTSQHSGRGVHEVTRPLAAEAHSETGCRVW